MKVLHLISSGGMYGAEAVILNLSATLNAAGRWQSILGIFANSSQMNLQLHEAATKASIPSILVPCRGQLDYRVPRTLRKLIHDHQIDLVHSHGYKADVYAYLALRRSGTPFVSTCHNWLDTNLIVRAYGALDRLVLRSFDGVVAVSEAVLERLVASGVSRQKIQLIRNGIRLELFAAAWQARLAAQTTGGLARIGIVGRLSPEKGIDVFLHAAAEISKQRPATKFFIAGDGPEKAALQQLIEQLGLTDRITLAGRVTNMPEFYQSIDILVLSSRIEGLPMTLLEGMASGLPVVATKVGAVPQIIHNDVTGLLADPEDPAQLAVSIIRLIDDIDLRQTLGERAHRLVANEYSADRMAADYVNLYEAALSRRSGNIATVHLQNGLK